MSEVYVYIYDLSNGMARQISLQLIGKQIDGIWHSGIVVYNQEIFFGSNGIECCQPEGTILGSPLNKVFVGRTNKTKEELLIHISKLSEDAFQGSRYQLLHHNCNSFSNVLATWLTGVNIPNYLINLPRDVLSTPLGSYLQPFIEKYSSVVSSTYTAVENSTNMKTFEIELTPVFFKESLSNYSTQYLMQPSLLNTSNGQLLMNLFDSQNDEFFFNMSSDLFDLIKNCTHSEIIDTHTKIVLFDVLRLRVTDNDTILTIMMNFFEELVETFISESENPEVQYVKSRLLSNLIGMIPKNQIKRNVLMQINKYATNLMRERTDDMLSSFIIRNLILHIINLDIDLCIEVASVLIYLISERINFSDKEAKENVMTSTYFLVKTYREIKDLAKSYDIALVIKPETPFSKILYKELQ